MKTWLRGKQALGSANCLQHVKEVVKKQKNPTGWYASRAFTGGDIPGWYVSAERQIQGLEWRIDKKGNVKTRLWRVCDDEKATLQGYIKRILLIRIYTHKNSSIFLVCDGASLARLALIFQI